MRSNRSPVRHSRAAAWLVELFAFPQEADGILGDLDEEFGASVARDGDGEARRRYRRHAWRTIWDLAVSPWRIRPLLSAGLAFSGLMLTMGFRLGTRGVAGPFVMATNLAAGAIVTHYPVYHYVPASLFWEVVFLFPSLMTGFIIALIARSIRLRPVSAALAVVAALAVWLALDRTILMWVYGAPPFVRITLASSVIRWARGTLESGGAVLIGAVLARFSFISRGAESTERTRRAPR